MTNILPKHDERAVQKRVAVALLEGMFDALDDPVSLAAMTADMSKDEFVALLDDANFQTECYVELVKRQQNGEAMRTQAKAGLSKAVEKVRAALEGDIPVGSAVKAGEFLHKVSGVGEEYSAELRKSDPGSRVGYAVVYDGDPEPDFSDCTQAFIIRLGFKRPAKERVINGEAIDVTPEVEARDVE